MFPSRHRSFFRNTSLSYSAVYIRCAPVQPEVVMSALVLLCLVVFAKVVLCAWPLPSDFAYWWWQTCERQRHSTMCIEFVERLTYNLAIVADNWLYIDAGEYYKPIGNTVTIVPCELSREYLHNAV